MTMCLRGMALLAVLALTIGCEALEQKRHPLGKDGYPHLRFKGYEASECSPETSKARVFRVVHETLISWDDLQTLPFYWNGERDVFRPEGAPRKGGIVMVDGEPRPYGLLCAGNLLIEGVWEWGPKGILLRRGTTLKHPWPPGA